MTGRVSFLAIPKWRDYLRYEVGKRLRDLFAREMVPIPPVDFYTPAEATKKGLPPTGWYDFQARRIGIVVDPDRPQAREWRFSTLLAVHENLHFLWNFTPRAFSLDTPVERRIWNIMLDCGNEQRAFLEDPWARRILRRGRQLILAEETTRWAEALDDFKKSGVPVTPQERGRVISMSANIAPVYEAGDLVLAAHTLLIAKGSRILTSLYRNHADPEAVWALLETELGPPSINIPPETWQTAFRLACLCWRERNEFVRADLVRDFMSLFPSPLPMEQQPDSSFDVGGHLGDQSANAEDPPGAEPLGNQKERHRTSDNDPVGEPDAGSPNNQESEPEPGQSTSPPSRTQDGADSTAHPSQSGDCDGEPLTFDPASGPAPDDSDDACDCAEGTVQDDTEALNQEARSWLDSGGLCIDGADRVLPADPTSLIEAALPAASELRQRLKLTMEAKVSRRAETGRPIARIIARVPDAAKPFRTRIGREAGLGPSIFGVILWDSSGSMTFRNKWDASRFGCMAGHLACEAAGIPHVVLLSRYLQHLAGVNINSDRGAALIAGAQPHPVSGDNYSNTLPLVFKQVYSREEDVKFVVVMTDGIPCGRVQISRTVSRMRQHGIATIGLGLDLQPEEAAGLESIFGKRYCVATLTGGPRVPSFASLLGIAITLAVQDAKLRLKSA